MDRKMDPVIHFEIPAMDAGHVAKFYADAFGWQTTALGPDFGGYTLASSVETDPKTRLPLKRGAINGGFYKRTKPDDSVRFTILVDDIREAMKKVEAAGGKVLGEPNELPGVGLFVSFADPEGNLATLNQDFVVKRLPD